MLDYKQLDELISNLEESSDQLVKLTDVANSVTGLVERQRDFAQKFETSVNELVEASSTLTKESTASGTRIDKHLAGTEKTIRTELTTLKEALQTGLTTIQQHSQAELTKLGNQLQSFQHDNRQFYSDLEKLLRLKMTEQSSELKQQIEQERGTYKVLLEEQTALITQGQQQTQRSIWIVGIILLMIGLLINAKVFGYL